MKLWMNANQHCVCCFCLTFFGNMFLPLYSVFATGSTHIKINDRGLCVHPKAKNTSSLFPRTSCKSKFRNLTVRRFFQSYRMQISALWVMFISYQEENVNVLALSAAYMRQCSFCWRCSLYRKAAEVTVLLTLKSF